MPIIDVITEDSGLAALWPAWQRLWRRAPAAWPFVSPAWLQPWWQAFGTGRPVVAIAHDNGELLGVLPLYRLEDKLLPIGVGISDYFDVLLTPDLPADTAAALLASALEAGDTSRCDLPELPPDATLLHTQAPPRWHNQSWASSVCPVLPLPPKPAIPKGMHRDLRQARHRADRTGTWRIERADAANLPVLLTALFALHSSRWQARGEVGVLSDPRVRGFHSTAAPELLNAGLLRLEAVRLADEIAAVSYALLASDRIAFYLSAFNPKFSFQSPGTLLLGHSLEQAFREDRQEAHLLRGGEAYKYAWGATDRFNTGRSFIRA
ncbi:MAG TPA: GNAT family N-acetyltransferase [Acetobacteraceae bacterium]|nr:GNAT family N-acetyltransferase [Acetobacteraceae bacterium]